MKTGVVPGSQPTLKHRDLPVTLACPVAPGGWESQWVRGSMG